MATNRTNANNSPIERIIKATTKIEANELRATVFSFLFVFTLMAAYYILRPVRDALSSNWTDAELSWLWTSTFFFSLIAVSVYGTVISRVKFKNLVKIFTLKDILKEWKKEVVMQDKLKLLPWQK